MLRPVLPSGPVIPSQPTKLEKLALQGRILGGAPLLAGMGLEDFAKIVGAATVATVFIYGVQRLWAARYSPFGRLSEINLVVARNPVRNKTEAQFLAGRLGNILIRKLRAVTTLYDQEYIGLPYTIAPQIWNLMQERRHELTLNYLQLVLGILDDFEKGISILKKRGWEEVYTEIFQDCLQKLTIVSHPMRRFQVPPSQEDLDEFRQFQKVLRNELSNLHLKIHEVLELQLL